MLIKTPDPIKPSEITDKQLYLNRRKFIRDSAKIRHGRRLAQHGVRNRRPGGNKIVLG